MKKEVRNGLAFALLWFAHGSSHGLAQQAYGTKDSDVVSSNDGSDNTTSLTTSTSTVSTSESQLPRTCRSGTVNYITHTLPQQCPTSAWSAPTTSAASLPETQTPTVDGSLGTSSSQENGAPSAEQLLTSSSATAAQQSAPSKPDALSTASPTLGDTDTATAPPASSSATSQPASADVESELESDSPLDNANFLSFEEWKKQNLASAGRAPDGGQGSDHRVRARPDIALDALGDEGEIELNFSGFGRPSPEKSRDEGEQRASTVDEVGVAPSHTHMLRNKDAGKTCKERSNYASFDCAATILKTNPEAKSASAILIENKDSYMLNPCSASNKFIIIELCDDILIDTLVLANYEFFSSIFRTFRVSVSDRYPVKADRWKELGIFEASNSRSVQAFLIEQPLIWAKYLRVEFLTHFGTEYYCPVSLLRVHGTTMMEEVNRGYHLDEGDDDVEIPAIEGGPDVVEAQERPLSVVEEIKSYEPVSTPVGTGTSVTELSSPFGESSSERLIDDAMSSTAGSSSPETRSDTTSTATNMPSGHNNSSIASSNDAAHSTSRIGSSNSDKATNITATAEPPPQSDLSQRWSSASGTILDKASGFLSDASATILGSSSAANNISTPSGSSVSATTAETASNSITTVHNATSSESAPESTTILAHSTKDSSTKSTSMSVSAPREVPPSKSATDSSSAASSPPQRPSTVQQAKHSSDAQSAPSQPQAQSQQIKSFSSSVQQKPTSSLSAPNSNPTTQESFFKSISTRLKSLEANSTLSLQYIESQSLQLRVALQAVEKRQLAKTSSFLSSLNATVLLELEKVKQDYERLWEGVVIELETQRRQGEREIGMVTERLGVLAEELVWQKRVGVVQTSLILLCLVLVIFARSGTGAGLEVSLLQQLQMKSGWGRDRSPDGFSYGDRSPISPPLSPSPLSPSGSIKSTEEFTQSKKTWPGVLRRGWMDKSASYSSLRDGDVSDSIEGRSSTHDGSVAINGNAVDSASGSISSRSGTHESGGGGDAKMKWRQPFRTPELRVKSATPTPTGSPLRVSFPTDREQSHASSEREANEYDELLLRSALDDEHPAHDGEVADDYEYDDETREDTGGNEHEGDDMETEEEEELEDSDLEILLPKETQSSPSTPGGTRDMQGIIGMVKEVPAWSPDEMKDKITGD